MPPMIQALVPQIQVAHIFSFLKSFLKKGIRAKFDDITECFLFISHACGTPLTDDLLFQKEEGESLEMSCVAQGEPAPNISWNFQVKD